MDWRGDEAPDEQDDLFDCPFCGSAALVWTDALIFGCFSCRAEFFEEDGATMEFIPE